MRETITAPRVFPRRPERPTLRAMNAQTEPSYRHPWPVRIWHWLNALAVTMLLLTGLLIFNIHPRLYWGEDGHAGMASFASLTASTHDKAAPRFDLQVGSHHWDVTGMMGVIDDEGNDVYVLIAAPFADFQFGATRTWHFAWAWVLVLCLIAYGLYLVIGGRFAAMLLPTRRDLSWRNIGHEFLQHLRFKRARGAAARRYNVLQKISYLIVVFILFPTIVLSGLTMSNAVTAAFPDLFTLFGGRQSARSVHFIAATLMLMFILVHLVQVLVAGFANSMGSMITGRYDIEREDSV
jgi:thiosulfate reductase cytochrome b subunit